MPAIDSVIFDSADPERLARFWAELLGRPIASRKGPYVILERDGGPGLVFQKTDAPKSGKNRVHLDLASPDPASDRARVEALGGRRVEGYEDGGFLVMADPEGNEFCLIPSGPFAIDDAGRAHYLDT